MSDEWRYGDILRRAIIKNPVQYSYVMYVAPAKGLFSVRRDFFMGVQLSEAPVLAVGEWANPPPVGAVRKRLRRDLFEFDPEHN